MGICRILLSPCGFGLLSEKCFAAGFVLPRISLGSLRSAISPPLQNEMARAGAGWRGNRELSNHPEPNWNSKTVPQPFAASGRIGFYMRVLSTGEIAAGDAMERVKVDSRGVTVRELMDVMYFKKQNVDVMSRAIQIPGLTPSWRDELKERLGRNGTDSQS